MKTTNQNQNYQLGLLHFAHLLVTVDGFVDNREKDAMKKLMRLKEIS
ncbi:MAG: hypothetical protein JST48_12750 [Bacteroidetes bacterium]|nr:hypothetical protein [Bacteroidota bacterium]